MLVQCPSCQTTYRVSDSLLTTRNPTFRCSRCKHIFALGLKTEASPAGEIPPAPSSAPKQQEEPELSFSSSPAEQKASTEKESTETPPPLFESEQASVEKIPDENPVEPAKSASDESFSFPKEATAPYAVREGAPQIEAEQSPLLNEERLDSWSLTRPQEEQVFTIPEENQSPQTASSPESSPAFEDEWPESLPLLEEREASPDLDPYRDRPFSIVPYIGLFGALLLIYSLLTLMYQAQPKTIEAVIKTIPWLGSAVLRNNHLRHGISLQSLRPSFQTIQGNREVFVLSGVAVNRNPVSVREVRVEGHIFNAEGKEIDRQIISLGNAISSKILRDLTSQEISILQKLNPQKRFEILPDESAGFVIVFLRPSTEVKNFSCRVLSVDAGV